MATRAEGMKGLKKASSAKALSQQALANYPKCFAKLAARGFMGHACTNGFQS